MAYYGVLWDLGAAIEGDRDASSHPEGRYTGEIWALSFVLDDEWDDSSLQERRWFERLEALDKAGITTRRLWAFDKKMHDALKKNPVEQDGRELIDRLSMYCADRSSFSNTLSFALPKEEISNEHVRLFGKGFFAVAFSDGQLRLIRGVCFDNLLSSNSLGGEIDFDDDRIGEIRRHWERYMRLGKPLKEYVSEVGSESAREYMRQAWLTPQP